MVRSMAWGRRSPAPGWQPWRSAVQPPSLLANVLYSGRNRTTNPTMARIAKACHDEQGGCDPIEPAPRVLGFGLSVRHAMVRRACVGGLLGGMVHHGFPTGSPPFDATDGAVRRTAA
jgi:hypothetical protein